MGKRPRHDEPGSWHHVANRGARKQQTFFNASDCRLFLYLLAEARRRFGLETHAFCLMGNHYHLLVHSPSGALSPAMQMIGTNYTRRFNRRHGFDGPLFKAAFWSNRITTDSYLLEASRYIHNNPKDLRPIVHPASYCWSSLRSYGNLGPKPGFLSIDVIKGIGGGTAAYRRFVDTGRNGHPSACDAGSTPYSGPADWTPGRLIAPSGGPTEIRLTDIDRRVASISGIPIEVVSQGGRGAEDLGRLLAVSISLDLTGAPTDAISRHYSFPTANALRAALRRNTELMTSERFTAIHAQAIQALE